MTSPEQAIAYKMGFVPEDRKQQGLFLGLTLRENITSACMKKVCHDGYVIDNRSERDISEQFVKAINIKTPRSLTKK